MKPLIRWVAWVAGGAIVGMVGLGFVAGKHPESPIGQFVQGIEAIQYRGDIVAVKNHKFVGQTVTIGEYWQELAGVGDIKWNAFGNVVSEKHKVMSRDLVCVEAWLQIHEKPVHVQYLYNRKTKGVEFRYLSFDGKTISLLEFLTLIGWYGI